MHEESLCKCGFPRWMGHSTDLAGEGMYGREWGHCLICEQAEDHPDGEDKREPGDFVYVANHLFNSEARAELLRILRDREN